MRGIKVGNFLMFRNAHICLICNIISNGDNTPAIIIGIDSNLKKYEGRSDDWSTIIGKGEELKEFSNAVFDKIIKVKQAKGGK